MTNMSRWSDAKLDKEMAFAIPASDGSPECVAWIAALSTEMQRRDRAKRAAELSKPH